MSEQAPYLEVIDGERKGTQYRLLAETATIGRSAECDICLENSRGVSRRHAQIFLLAGRVRIKDLESQNGTFVDGARVSDAILPPGSIIKVGDVSLRLVMPSGATAAPLPGRRPSEARPVNQRNIAKLAAEGRGALAEAPPVGEEAAEALLAAAGHQSRSVVTAISIIIAIMGTLYAISQALRFEPLSVPAYRAVQTREEKVIATAVYFRDFKLSPSSRTAEGMPLLAVERYRGQLAESVEKINRRNRANGDPQLYFLVVKGLERGDAVIKLYDDAGAEAAEIHVLVRGALPPEFVKLSPEAARERAGQYLRAAQAHRASGEIYRAIMALERAADLLKSHAKDDAAANDALRQKVDLETRLKSDLCYLFDTAMTLAFPDKATPHISPRLDTAFMNLESAKRLVPNEQCLEWQVLDLWQAEIRRMLR